MKAKNFDEAFDKGESVVKNLDTKRARRLNTTPKRVNVDFPNWMVTSLDNEAERLGVTRQSLVKMWIAERLEENEKQAA